MAWKSLTERMQDMNEARERIYSEETHKVYQEKGREDNYEAERRTNRRLDHGDY